MEETIGEKRAVEKIRRKKVLTRLLILESKRYGLESTLSSCMPSVCYFTFWASFLICEMRIVSLFHGCDDLAKYFM